MTAYLTHTFPAMVSAGIDRRCTHCGILEGIVARTGDRCAGQPSSETIEEMVNHPIHYGGAENIYEHIKVVQAWGLNYQLGNATKYIARAGKKDPAKAIEDLEKAKFYLEYEIKLRKQAAGG